MNRNESIVRCNEPILITGASGFIGRRVVENMLDRGFTDLRCFVRQASSAEKMASLVHRRDAQSHVRLFRGNLLSAKDCEAAVQDVPVILHLAAGRGEKSFPDAFVNSVVTTRNLLQAAVQAKALRRFVNISSFAVYTNVDKPNRHILDESCPVEDQPALRGEAYCYAKVKQDELVREFGKQFHLPFVIVRPGYVYGQGNEAITGRIGITTFGPFLHLGGGNPIPFTYVDNCADAIVLAALRPRIEQETFNVVDDDLPTSRQFLRLYKQQVASIRSVYVPHVISYALCFLWQEYSARSARQLPPVFNLKRWHAYWKKTYYTNQKLKALTGWAPSVSTEEGLRRYFAACRERSARA